MATLDAPRFSYTLPGGTVVEYDEYLVFLSKHHGTPGARMMAAEFFRVMADELRPAMKLKEWTENPLALIEDAAKWLGGEFKNESALEEAMTQCHVA